MRRINHAYELNIYAVQEKVKAKLSLDSLEDHTMKVYGEADV